MAFFKFQMGFLPPNLYLQMDNCFHENKNECVISFLCILVEMGIFEKVFFMVWIHTVMQLTPVNWSNLWGGRAI